MRITLLTLGLLESSRRADDKLYKSGAMPQYVVKVPVSVNG